MTRKAPAQSDGAGTEAAARVADVLLLFTSGPTSLGVTAISRQLGLSKAVVHRILQSLTSREVLVSDPVGRGYRLGPATAALGARALRESGLRAAAVPVLRSLRDATGETTTLSALVGDERVYLVQFEGTHEIKMTVEIGRRFPLHAGASSKAILAFLPDDRREAVLTGPLPALTPATTTDARHLREEIEGITADRVAISGGERQHGAASLAAPVFGVDSEVAGSISLCGPIGRFDHDAIERYRPLVREAAEEISTALGWAGVTDDAVRAR